MLQYRYNLQLVACYISSEHETSTLRTIDNHITSVNLRTALSVFVEIISSSWDNMNGIFRWFMVRYIYAMVRYMASLD